MFTGIIEEVGRIASMERRGDGAYLRIGASLVLQGTKVGDSISTNGVCLTVASLGTDSFTADVMPETISRSSFSCLHPGSPVNLERAAVLGERIGGHLVSGHIDGTGVVASIIEDSDAVRITVEADPSVVAGLVEKGSVALEGISLTVTEVGTGSFGVSLVPHTFTHTTLGSKREGSVVNIECDVIGKYVFRALGVAQASSGHEVPGGITYEMLLENGF